MTPDDRRFCAYVINPALDMPLTTAPVDRDWMDRWHDRAPYRCLPMVIANQAGWLIHNATAFTAVWTGEHAQDSLRITRADDRGPGAEDRVPGFSFQVSSAGLPPASSAPPPPAPVPFVTSLFGGGVLTFNVPYLFRTPPGLNLWVKGPANWIKDGVQPLEAVVESDWMVASFTMNWKMTRPHHPVRFDRGEPICMVVPVPRGLAEGLDPVTRPLASDAAMLAEYQAWEQKRDSFNAKLWARDAEAVKRGWQREYMQGKRTTGEAAPAHQTRLRLKEFRADVKQGDG